MTQEEMRRAIQMMAEAVAKERAARFGDGAEVTEDDMLTAVAAYNALDAFMKEEEMLGHMRNDHDLLIALSEAIVLLLDYTLHRPSTERHNKIRTHLNDQIHTAKQQQTPTDEPKTGRP